VSAAGDCHLKLSAQKEAQVDVIATQPAQRPATPVSSGHRNPWLIYGIGAARLHIVVP